MGRPEPGYWLRIAELWFHDLSENAPPCAALLPHFVDSRS
jgi:hypothetical protein